MRSRRSIQIRQVRQWVTASSAIALVPWILYLAASLPQDYTAQNWRATWVGFDLFLLILIATTTVLGYLQHHLLTHFAFATGILLICDAWFDVMTAQRADVFTSALSATFGELPLAAILISGTLRIIRLNRLSPLSHRTFIGRFLRAIRSSFILHP